MLVKAFEVVEGQRVDLIQGDYPDDHIDDLQVGARIPLIGVKLKQFLLGDIGERKNAIIGWYLIEDRIEMEAKIGVPFVELSLNRIS
jgi:hypothetical protein